MVGSQKHKPLDFRFANNVEKYQNATWKRTKLPATVSESLDIPSSGSFGTIHKLEQHQDPVTTKNWNIL